MDLPLWWALGQGVPVYRGGLRPWLFLLWFVIVHGKSGLIPGSSVYTSGLICFTCTMGFAPIKRTCIVLYTILSRPDRTYWPGHIDRKAVAAKKWSEVVSGMKKWQRQMHRRMVRHAAPDSIGLTLQKRWLGGNCSWACADAYWEKICHKRCHRTPKEKSEDLPESMSEDMSEDTREKMSEDMSKDLPEKMSEYMQEKISEQMSIRMQKDLSENMPKRTPEDMPERMSENMSEDMPERMPEDTQEKMSEKKRRHAGRSAPQIVRRYDRRFAWKRCQKICHKICQKECQKKCQKKCQKECQRICRKKVAKYSR